MDSFTAFFGQDHDYFLERNCGFTSAEIAQQPRLWTETAALMAAKKQEIASFLARVGDLRTVRVVFTGAGSSAFIGDALAPLVGKDLGLRAESVPTTDLVAAPGSYLFADVPTLLVSFARSGNSPESVGAVDYARKSIHELYEIAITCDATSKLYDCTMQSDRSLVLLMPAGANDNGFAMTSSVSCMLMAGYLLFAGDCDRAETETAVRADIDLLARSVTSAAPHIAAVARHCAEADFDRIAYLGSGFLRHIAHEASLKMMELTCGAVNGSYESSTGFRHGPKSVIKDKTVTVHMISPDPFTARYDLDLLREVYGQKKRNTVITLCGEDVGDLPGDVVLRVASRDYQAAGALCMGLEMLVFCQMLALFKSLALGVPTDNPSPTGEVNRVVKGVTVYALDGNGTETQR
ncbi:MAG: SIS domain-containing protein [Coriobacteriia bacterium]|nr:SIS domain-containing protein [Coriobacteriia bacterium]